jgi:tetratricopeptide (TPR) repeat protein
MKIRLFTLVIFLTISLGAVAQSQPLSSEQYCRKGLSSLRKKEFSKGVSYFTKAIEINAKDMEYYLNRAHAYRGMKKFEEALSDYNMVLEMSPEDFNAILGKGISEKRLKQLNKAIQTFSFGISKCETYIKNNQVDPRSVENPFTAAPIYARISAMQGRLKALYFNRSSCSMLNGDFQSALDDCNWLAKHDANSAIVYLLRGTIFMKIGNLKSSSKDLKKAKRMGNKKAEKLLETINSKK